MKNIVVLKNLPSNLVDEAIVVLKSNKKIKKIEYSEKKNLKKGNSNIDIKNKQDYIIKEAEIVISDYITKLENQNLGSKLENSDLIKKYKRLKIATIGISILLFLFIFLKIGS